MFGTFSGGGLGMGVAFTLEDAFSRTATEIERKMGSLEGSTEKMESKINKAMDRIKLGTTLVAAGSAIVAPFSQ